jgi:hypothetical protein
MWEVALVYFIFRISFVYYTVTLMGCGAVIFLYNSASIAEHLPISLVSPFIILAIILISRILIYYYEIPRVLGFRLAIGVLALILLILSYALACAITCMEGFNCFPPQAGGVNVNELIILSVFVLMPAVWILCEGTSDRQEKAVGHDQKAGSNSVSQDLTSHSSPQQTDIK